jgi:hypothetical protein
MKTTHIVTRIGFDGEARAHFQHSHAPSAQADFAMRLMTQFALVAVQEDGEDSAGRQKARVLGAAEAAKRACDISAAAFDEFNARGWLIEIPPLTEEQVKKMLDRD